MTPTLPQAGGVETERAGAGGCGRGSRGGAAGGIGRAGDQLTVTRIWRGRARSAFGTRSSRTPLRSVALMCSAS